AKLVNPKTGKPDEMAKNWHDKLWRSMVTEVLGKGETPERGQPELSCKVEYTWHGKQKGFIEVGRLMPAQTLSTSTTPLAAEWAGALKELDTLDSDEIERRVQACEAGETAPWMAWMARYHELMRAALAIRRNAAGGAAGGAAGSGAGGAAGGAAKPAAGAAAT